LRRGSREQLEISGKEKEKKEEEEAYQWSV
jgi:hypothetical protein